VNQGVWNLVCFLRNHKWNHKITQWNEIKNHNFKDKTCKIWYISIQRRHIKWRKQPTSHILHNHFYRAENTSEKTPIPNKNKFTLLQDGKDCLPERVHGVKNKKQGNMQCNRHTEITKSQVESWNHKWNHEITNKIIKSLISKSRTPFKKVVDPCGEPHTYCIETITVRPTYVFVIWKEDTSLPAMFNPLYSSMNQQLKNNFHNQSSHNENYRQFP